MANVDLLAIGSFSLSNLDFSLSPFPFPRFTLLEGLLLSTPPSREVNKFGVCHTHFFCLFPLFWFFFVFFFEEGLWNDLCQQPLIPASGQIAWAEEEGVGRRREWETTQEGPQPSPPPLLPPPPHSSSRKGPFSHFLEGGRERERERERERQSCCQAHDYVVYTACPAKKHIEYF